MSSVGDFNHSYGVYERYLTPRRRVADNPPLIDSGERLVVLIKAGPGGNDLEEIVPGPGQMRASRPCVVVLLTTDAVPGSFQQIRRSSFDS